MIFFIVCLIVLLIIGFLIFFIEVKIETKNLEIKIKDKNFKLNENGKITIRFTIINKIDLFKFTTNINRFKLPESKNKYDKIKNHIVKNNNIKIKDIQKKLKVKYENINLNIEIGEENAAITAILTGVVSGVVSIIIGKYFSDIKKINWNVQPIYNMNILKLSLNGIISVKLLHIINTIFMMRKDDDKNARTSNRKNLKYIYE